MSWAAYLSEDQLDTWPLHVLHALLKRIEREIDRALTGCIDAIPGEGYRAKWDNLRYAAEVQEIYPIEQQLRREFTLVARVVCRKEAEELAALRAEFRQSDDPAVARVISEAIAIERSL